MVARLVFALMGLGLTSCERKPTASEVFHLRSECVTAANKMLKTSSYMIPSPGDPMHAVSDPQIRYDEEKNRCYVELYFSRGAGDDQHMVLDGQTGQQLASTRSVSPRNGNKEYYYECSVLNLSVLKRDTNSDKSGWDKIKGLNTAGGHFLVEAYISELMGRGK